MNGRSQGKAGIIVLRMKRRAERGREAGRQSKFTLAAGERVCALIADGGFLRSAGDAVGVSASTVLRWARANEGFAERYARACEVRLAVLEERLLELCALGHEAALDAECGQVRLQAVKLEIDTLKWILSKLVRQRFGDGAAVSSAAAAEKRGSDAAGGLSAEQEEELVRRIAEQKARILEKKVDEQEEVE